MALERLLKGFKDFRNGYYREHHDLFEKLATEGQSPKILIVGCADARVDPGILTQTKPGDIFTVRNVAAMVPPAQFPPDTRHHGTSSAIEFAVRGLGVEHVVVLGHALCGGIGALVDGRDSIYASYDYLSTWTAIAQEVRDLAVAKLKGRSREEIARAVEQAAVLNSVSNLMGFRWIAEKVESGALALHAWWFNMTEGQLYAFNPQTAAFEAVHGIKVQPTVVKGTTLSDVDPDQFISAVAARAQQSLPAIGFFHSGSPEQNVKRLAAYRKGLAAAGFVEGKNVTIDFRWAAGQNAKLPELAADLVAKRVAVIVTLSSTPAAVAAKAATNAVPIYFLIADPPVQLGLVASMNRPGGNASGIITLNVELCPSGSNCCARSRRRPRCSQC